MKASEVQHCDWRAYSREDECGDWSSEGARLALKVRRRQAEGGPVDERSSSARHARLARATLGSACMHRDCLDNPT